MDPVIPKDVPAPMMLREVLHNLTDGDLSWLDPEMSDREMSEVDADDLAVIDEHLGSVVAAQVGQLAETQRSSAASAASALLWDSVDADRTVTHRRTMDAAVTVGAVLAQVCGDVWPAGVDTDLARLSVAEPGVPWRGILPALTTPQRTALIEAWGPALLDLAEAADAYAADLRDHMTAEVGAVGSVLRWIGDGQEPELSGADQFTRVQDWPVQRWREVFTRLTPPQWSRLRDAAVDGDADLQTAVTYVRVLFGVFISDLDPRLLTELPSELLTRIVEQAPKGSLTALMDFSRVDQRLHALLQPILDKRTADPSHLPVRRVTSQQALREALRDPHLDRDIELHGPAPFTLTRHPTSSGRKVYAGGTTTVTVTGGRLYANGQAMVIDVTDGDVFADGQATVTRVSGGQVTASGWATVTGVTRGSFVSASGRATVTGVSGGQVTAYGWARVTGVTGGRLFVHDSAEIVVDLTWDEVIHDEATGCVLWLDRRIFITGLRDEPIPDTVQITWRNL